jgi:hypothetical protein
MTVTFITADGVSVWDNLPAQQAFYTAQRVRDSIPEAEILITSDDGTTAAEW